MTQQVLLELATVADVDNAYEPDGTPVEGNRAIAANVFNLRKFSSVKPRHIELVIAWRERGFIVEEYQNITADDGTAEA